jgi:hypothetical protein
MVDTVVEELHELLDREELTCHMEALVAREKKVGVSKWALIKVSQDLDAEWAKTKATHEEYLKKMRATPGVKHTLGLYKMLGNKKVLLVEKERDLELWKVTLVEA